MKQSDDPKAFFEKYQFTMCIEKPCPESGDIMKFEGLEARYVQRLEHHNSSLENYVKDLREQLDFWRNKDYHDFKRNFFSHQKDKDSK